MIKPWVRNVVSPTRYRMQLAREFSQKARCVFGDRWKGLYVIGSTASDMCHHLGDLDVFPLIEGPRTDGEAEVYHVRWQDLGCLSERIERQRGVSIEMWKTNLKDPAMFCDLEVFRVRGPETIITSEAVLVDVGPGVGLPPFIARPEWRADYTSASYSWLRGEDPTARHARMAYEREQARLRRQVLERLQNLLPRFDFEDLAPWVAAFIFHRNLIMPPNIIPKGFDIYYRFEFLVSHEPAIQAFLGIVPTRSAMIDALFRLTKRLKSPHGEDFRQRLILLSRMLNDTRLEGLPGLLIDDPRLRMPRAPNP